MDMKIDYNYMSEYECILHNNEGECSVNEYANCFYLHIVMII